MAVEELLNSNVTQVPCGDPPACCAGTRQGSHQPLTQIQGQLVPGSAKPQRSN